MLCHRHAHAVNHLIEIKPRFLSEPLYSQASISSELVRLFDRLQTSSVSLFMTQGPELLLFAD